MILIQDTKNLYLELIFVHDLHSPILCDFEIMSPSGKQIIKIFLNSLCL